MTDLQKVHGLIGTILSFTIGFRTNSGTTHTATHTQRTQGTCPPLTHTYLYLYLYLSRSSVDCRNGRGVLHCLTLLCGVLLVCGGVAYNHYYEGRRLVGSLNRAVKEV